MADDDRRVEPRTVLVGTGACTTPERIAKIEQRARELADIERRYRRPAKPFGRVLAEQAAAQAASEADEEKTEAQAPPRQGPRPALVHPRQRDTYGRERKPDEKVVLKG